MQTQPSVPPGFRKGVGGLLLPEHSSRRRVVLTWPDWRALEKAATVLSDPRVHVEYVMRCADPDCNSRKIERVRMGHGLSLRCGCTDRLFERRL